MSHGGCGNRQVQPWRSAAILLRMTTPIALNFAVDLALRSLFCLSCRLWHESQREFSFRRNGEFTHSSDVGARVLASAFN